MSEIQLSEMYGIQNAMVEEVWADLSVSFGQPAGGVEDLEASYSTANSRRVDASHTAQATTRGPLRPAFARITGCSGHEVTPSATPRETGSGTPWETPACSDLVAFSGSSLRWGLR
jgi:hypothetical protein